MPSPSTSRSWIAGTGSQGLLRQKGGFGSDAMGYPFQLGTPRFLRRLARGLVRREKTVAKFATDGGFRQGMGDSRSPGGGSSLLPQVEVNGYGHRSIASLSRGGKKGEDGCRDCSETEDVNKANLGRPSFPREGGEWHGRGEILVFHRRAKIKESVPKE